MTMTRPPGAAKPPGRRGGPAHDQPGQRLPGQEQPGLRVAGFRIRLTGGAYLLGIVAVLVSAVALPAAVPGRSAAAYLAATAGVLVLLLASILGHELAHAITARRHGAVANEIRVGFLGATGHGHASFTTPRGLWRTAIAGPLASLAASGIAFAATQGLAALGTGRLAILVLAAAGWINLVLAGTSLLPASGLDGGRLVHAAVWAKTGASERGAMAAARAGQITGAALVAGGVVAVALGYLSALWIGLLGVLMVTASRARARQIAVTSSLDGLLVTDIVPAAGTPLAMPPAWQTVLDFLEDDTPGSPAADPARAALAFPLRGFSGEPSGLLTLSQLAAAPPDGRDALRLSDIATPIRDVVITNPDEPLNDLMARLSMQPASPAALHTTGHALVVDSAGAPVAVLTPSDFSRASQLGALHLRRQPA